MPPGARPPREGHARGAEFAPARDDGGTAPPVASQVMRVGIRAPRAVTAVACLALTAAACGDTGGTGEHTTGENRTDTSGNGAAARAVERFLDARWPRGASGTVVTARGGKVVTCDGRGMADRETETRARCDTVYDIGSVTKQFTAAAIMKLEAEGRLAVSDPLRRFVPGVPPDKRGITLHHLLTHTSGLPEQLGDDYAPVSRSDLLRSALAAPLASPPGERYAYSNLGYSVLAAVVEKASGMGYEEYLADRLFRPAGMTATGYVLPRWDRARVAVEYDEKGRPHGTPLDHPWADDGPYWNLRGNGGMLSTARDMLRWHRALLGDRILDDRARARMFEPYVDEGEGGGGGGSGIRSAYGYGWSILSRDGARVATHDGGNGKSAARLTRFLDDGVLVFWVSNHAARAGRWDVGRLDPGLTEGLAARARGGRAGG